MSKLFNTLEQIRRNESYQVSGSGTNASSGTTTELKRKKALFVLTLAVACFALVYFVGPLILQSGDSKNVHQKAENMSGVSSDSPEKSPGAVEASILLPQGGPKELNDLAARLIDKNEHWRGIYLLDGIIRQHPEMIEPFINISVALAELGLFEPAKRYLEEAMRIDPENQALLDNLLIMKKSGIIDNSFGPKIRKEAREAKETGHSWFSRSIPDSELFPRSLN
ncbi:MAG: hypothetical protein KKG47_14760 [Proteobacteria bacterium]|nr:hypothetical protein [Pseudomonadota bacterium]MBU1739847.1 hypothetical protein [Pseudomonadota bacterium]